MFTKISPKHIEQFQNIVGKENVLFDTDSLSNYSHDETEDLKFLPEVVLKPNSAEQISEILKLCNKELIPLTPRGAGTGLSGGALPVFGGVILSTERLNKILEIDERNLQATAEPGVITQVFQEAVIEKGLFYPPDPSSRGSCFLGGNLAESAGGPRAVKYGVTKEYVLNLEMVLPTGEIIWTGANVLKNSTGYNLTQLIVGSEGTLGVITKIVFKLLPHPKKNVVMLVPFFSAEKASEAVSAVFRAGVIPSALEFMERDAIDFAHLHLLPKGGVHWQKVLPFGKDLGWAAFLLIEVDGNDLEVMMKEVERITEVMEKYECGEILFADTEEQKENLWRMRRCLGEAVKSHSVYKEEDTVVPRAELPKLLAGVKAIGKKYGFKSVCYGHAGDGNLHVNIIKAEMSDNNWNNEIPKAIREIFTVCKELKGTISGEHGIGWVQKNYMDIAFHPKAILLQKEIKKLFDPNGIMNPGKMFV
ncbi:MAG: FAD-binding protein [Bacteroidetes bacterium]|nr:FAD-binding protein [Bacteroidota bacterium]